MLTRKQRDLLLYIHSHMESKGLPPSFDEMKDALDLKSKSGIHRLVTALEERGFIRRLAHRARAVEIVRLPEDMIPARKTENRTTDQANNVVPLKSGASAPETGETPSAQLPLYGKIAAGTPIEAISDPSNFVDVPPHLVGSGEHYALTIDGDSMIEAGILDGDTIVLERTSRVENGTIAVALVHGEEATLKRIYHKGQEVILEPANATHTAQHFHASDVQIQGRLVGLVRNYH
ncbi:transcriptional repressor LexA [Kiloniella sp. b19]|uniref:transcriptional repressor LexA n=1 Tax=Kiloniella sp. GXU_MW_B19 TaxID=3141326 RepID=UPI0031E47301